MKRTKLTRRQLLRLSAFAGTGAVIAACGAPAATTAPAATEAPAAARAPAQPKPRPRLKPLPRLKRRPPLKPPLQLQRPRLNRWPAAGRRCAAQPDPDHGARLGCVNWCTNPWAHRATPTRKATRYVGAAVLLRHLWRQGTSLAGRERRIQRRLHRAHHQAAQGSRVERRHADHGQGCGYSPSTAR